jgi:predicted TIM-barrel fold metal-dependent hydrolase
VALSRVGSPARRDGCSTRDDDGKFRRLDDMTKLWAHSGDSHFLEPEDLWQQILPAPLAERMPRSEMISDDEEMIHVDGQSFRRRLPKVATKKDKETGLSIAELVMRPPGARDLDARLRDLDEEGIWGEVIYASLGLWENMIQDRSLVKAASRAQNEWKASEIQGRAPNRLVPAASVPMLVVEDAVEELLAAAAMGLKLISLPTGVPDGVDDYNRDTWEPLWAAAEESGMVVGFHIGSDTGDQVSYRGPGGAVLNYVETTYGGQRVATKLVASGALDRHPTLKILISEGGATWVPFLGDRMNEGYRQHGMFVRPTLSVLPKEILYRQVYASFQHDESATAALTAMGYPNVMWGSDYPHIEGTFGHTQKTLHELFDGVDPRDSERIRIGTFRELFPHVSEPPAA